MQAGFVAFGAPRTRLIWGAIGAGSHAAAAPRALMDKI